MVFNRSPNLRVGSDGSVSSDEGYYGFDLDYWESGNSAGKKNISGWEMHVVKSTILGMWDLRTKSHWPISPELILDLPVTNPHSLFQIRLLNPVAMT